MSVGRFAPSPTAALHLGNLRTAMLSWLFAGATPNNWILRFEDLDRVTSSPDIAAQQQHDLASLGMSPAQAPVFQSDRFAIYNEAIATLTEQGLTYECFCSRKEVLEAAAAPHGQLILYPGTCRSLSAEEREQKRALRTPALRLNASKLMTTASFTDVLAGYYEGPVDDVVLRRNDGVPSYNVAVVVDDAAQGITQVVRGNDLVFITPTQIALQKALGLPQVEYAHVPLVVGPDGERLAKRHGAVTMTDLTAQGVTTEQIREWILTSLGQRDGHDFDLSQVPRHPVEGWKD